MNMFFVTAKDSEGEVIRLIPQATMDTCNDSAIVLNPTDYERLNTRIDAPVVIIYDPLYGGCDFKVDINAQREFFDFMEILSSNDISNVTSFSLISKWISEINQNNIVDSLAFCLLTGRRLYQKKDDIDEKPFIEFSYPKFKNE